MNKTERWHCGSYVRSLSEILQAKRVEVAAIPKRQTTKYCVTEMTVNYTTTALTKMKFRCTTLLSVWSRT